MLLGEFVSFSFLLFYFSNNKDKIDLYKNIKLIADAGFGTVSKVDAGYYSQGIFFLLLL